MAGQMEVKDLHTSSSIQHFPDLQPQELKNKKIQNTATSCKMTGKEINT